MAAVIAPNHTYESIESTLILLFQIPYDWPNAIQASGALPTVSTHQRSSGLSILKR
jgi:hypothetical protein